MIYIFDIDGTLTPSRDKMNSDFQKFFLSFIQKNRVWLISGSDKEKTIEQIGDEVWISVERAYQCAGNMLFQNGELIKENGFELKPYLHDKLMQLLSLSNVKKKFGIHIEARPGMVNFSTIGRRCDRKSRKEYYQWDLEHKEREFFCDEIKTEFPWLDATVGGEISIDIYPKGRDKGQIVEDVDDDFTFFGDRLQVGGNDYPIYKKVQDLKLAGATFYNVESWEDTYNILSSI